MRHGVQLITYADRHELIVTRRAGAASLEARINFNDANFIIEESTDGRSRTRTHWDEF